MDIDIEVTGLRELIVDLGEAVSGAPDKVAKVAGRGALNIKRDWQRRWSGHPHIAQLPGSISYDVTTSPFEVSAEIGPDKTRRPQAALAHIIELGSPTSAPIPGGLPALDAEAPKFEQALAELGEKLIMGEA